MQWSFLYFYRLTVGGQGKGDLCGNIDTEGLITIPQFTYKDEGFLCVLEHVIMTRPMSFVMS